MSSIAKIRLGNIIYDNGKKVIQDMAFDLEGKDTAMLLENGGGKTMMIQLLCQSVIPNIEVAGRKLKDTIKLDNNTAHIAVEWIIAEKPKTYCLSHVSLYKNDDRVEAVRYLCEYEEGVDFGLDSVPFSKAAETGKRGATYQEMTDFFREQGPVNGRFFRTNKEYAIHLKDRYGIDAEEWRKIAAINSGEGEGGLAKFFAACTNSRSIVDRFLIPAVEDKNAKNDFSKTFEKHIENFKSYNELVKTIEEVKSVQSNLKGYRILYEEGHGRELELNVLKGQLRSMTENIVDQQEAMSQKQEALSEQLRQNQQENQALVRGQKDGELSAQIEEVERLEREYQKVSDQFEAIFDQEKRLIHQINRGRLLDHQHHLEERVGERKALENQLHQMERADRLQSLQQRLTQNAGELRFLYEKEWTAREQRRKVLEIALADEEKQLDQLKTHRRNSTQQENEYRKAEATYRNTHELKNQDMQKIRKELMLPGQTTFRQYISDQKSETIAKEKQSQELARQLESARTQCAAEQQNRENLRKEEVRLLAKADNLRDKIQEIQKKKEDFTAALLQERQEGSIYYDVYDQQAKILEDLKFQQSRAEQEESRSRELYLRKQIDYTKYADMDHFMADRFLSDYIDKHNMDGQMEKGTIYAGRLMAELELSTEELIRRYPDWAATLITYSKGPEKILEDLNKHTEHLTLPITVLTAQEIRAHIERAADNQPNRSRTEGLAKATIIPHHWEEFLDAERFGQWKDIAKADLEEAEREKQQRTQTAEKKRRLRATAKLFYENYPASFYHDMEQEQEQAQVQGTQTKNQREESDKQVELLQDQEKQILSRIRLLEAETHEITRNIIKAQDGAEKEEAAEIAHQEAFKAHQLLDREIDKGAQIEREQEGRFNEINRLKEVLGQEDFQKRQLAKEEAYIDTLEATPLATDKTLAQGRKERSQLKEEERGVFGEKADLENRIRDRKTEERRIQQEIDLLLQEIVPLAESDDLSYDDGLSEKIQAWIRQKQELERQRHQLDQNKERAQSQWNIMQGQFQSKEKNYRDQYQEPFRRSADWQQEGEKIQLRLIENEQSKRFIEKAQAESAKKQGELAEAKAQLDITGAHYHYNVEEISKVPLSEATVVDLSYQPLSVIATFRSKMEETANNLAHIRQKIDTEKERVKEFVEGLTDPQLIKATKSGLNSYHAYKEVAHWLDKNDENLSNIIRMKEQGKQDSEKDFYHLVGSIYQHIVLLVNEFDKIMNNTRIKFGDQWQNIYDIQVPTIEEEQARKTIEHIMRELIEELDKDQEGDKRKTKVIQERLESKSILHRLTEDNIKIRIRKVQNDQNLSNRFFPFEVSRHWSGGERWSKNMALFLGILKYINGDDQRKDKRTVILDNPFGEASSDHVLAPVFLVTNQLGYQVIAFTAHSGSFIVDNFQSVQSMKFRKGINSAQQILQKEISRAYMNQK